MIHCYQSNGYSIVMDVNSGAVHVVDDLVYQLVPLLEPLVKEKKDKGEILDFVKAQQLPYTEEETAEAVDEILLLAQEGQLYTEDIYENYIDSFKNRETVVKALCLHIAHDCNLACRYCFAEEGEYHGRRAIMSYEVGKKALDFLVANSGNRTNLEVDFFGGEPLMNWEVVKQLVAYGRSLEEEHHKKFRFTITTNGVLLNDEILDAQIDGMNLAQIAEQRTAKSCHFGSVYKNEYQAIKYAYQMMKAVSVMEVTSDIKEMVADYQKQTYLIDSYYRWFYSAYDCMEDTERFAQVRERIENMYSFTYLQKVTPKWNQELTENLMADTGLKRQEDFYRNYLNAYEGKNRVIVIISDAFRYECAKELMERLELDEKCTPKLECMISGLPSVTSLGMASLLPHKELHVDEKLNVTVDGQSCGDLASRDKILKVQNENNVVLSFDEVASANKEKIRELLQKKNIVYIYHNQVDARGDKPASENEVFTACSEAIEEIHKLIKKLTGYISAAKFFVTADHGFLYKRDKLHEFDKVSYDREICAYSNKRFLLTTQKVNEPGMKSRMMAYMNHLYVTTPIGADIFKVAGGGQNYVHGGSSLQEMLIPVIELTTNTRAVAYDYVDVILTSVNRKVTNLITYFDFIQTEKVTDTMKARSLVAYFTTEDGEKISFDVPIVANSREDAPEKRTFHEKFTLKSREYKYGDKYYLVLADANNEKNILQQYEFMIDIAFVDDFGF
mgnify:CR=1 FL=1